MRKHIGWILALAISILIVIGLMNGSFAMGVDDNSPVSIKILDSDGVQAIKEGIDTNTKEGSVDPSKGTSNVLNKVNETYETSRDLEQRVTEIEKRLNSIDNTLDKLNQTMVNISDTMTQHKDITTSIYRLLFLR